MDTWQSLVAGLIEEFEEFNATPKPDTKGAWKIGFGLDFLPNGRPVGPDTPAITEDLARSYYLAKCSDLHAAIMLHDDSPDGLDAGGQAALVDWSYNLGLRALFGSTLWRKHLAGDSAGAAAEFPKWDHEGAVEVPGLLRRRKAEQALFAGDA